VDASLLQGSVAGDRDSTRRLMETVYGELRALAGRYMRAERPSHTLQPTALVHEAFLRLVGQTVEWHGRAHFFAIAAQEMRRVLIDHARRHGRDKRGGALRQVSLDGNALEEETPVDVLALHEAIERLAACDARQARVVELRFYGGLTMPEIAELLGVSEKTAANDWRFAKAWLRHALDGHA
jgi:RNA polymerase sigma factor (TIGR02999 family)